jgi:hypothetical protein
VNIELSEPFRANQPLSDESAEAPPRTHRGLSDACVAR